MRNSIRFITETDVPDEHALEDLGYGLTGEFREPRLGERYVAYTTHSGAGNPTVMTRQAWSLNHTPNRHIVERIPLDPPEPEPVASALVEVETTRTIRVLGLELDETTARRVLRELEEVLS